MKISKKSRAVGLPGLQPDEMVIFRKKDHESSCFSKIANNIGKNNAKGLITRFSALAMACFVSVGSTLAGGESETSSEMEVVEVSKITDLKANATSCSSVKLSWSDVAGEDEYRVRRKPKGASKYSIVADVSEGTENFTDKSAKENTTYIYMVRPMVNGKADNISNTPEVSTPKCGTSGPVATNAISDLKATAVSCSEVKLTWSDIAGEDAYRVRRKIEGQSTFTNIGDVSANTVSFNDKTAKANTSYVYMVRPMQNGTAVDISNQPQVKTPGCTSGGGTISDITNLKAVANSCTEVKLTWSDVAAEDAYRVRRKTPDTKFVVLKDIPANSTSFIDKTAKENTTYIYMVRPMQNGKAVKVSNRAKLTTPKCNDNNPPTGGCDAWFNSNGIWKGKGRIAISSDGNEHDKDDWAATPFSLALLASKGLQDKLVLYTYSDHVWGSNREHSDARQQMRTSALGGADHFGFDRSHFIEAVADPNKAYNAMADAINQSSAGNPLFIVAAGPMQVVGEGLNRAQESKLQYVTVISHSKWNDNHSDRPTNEPNHSGWTWNELTNKFNSKGVRFLHIVDQNGGSGYDGMRANMNKFSWLKTSSARNNNLYKSGSWEWLYNRQVAAKKNTDFDPSDAGMIIFLLTGKQKTDPSDAKNLMENPVAPCTGNSRLAEYEELEFMSEKLSIFPNPSFGNFEVVLPAENVINGVKLYDLNGNPIQIEYTVESESNLRVSRIYGDAGTYILQIETEGKTYSQKIMKQ